MKDHELLKECELVSLGITGKMAENVEVATQDQNKSKLWYKYRAGRITASRIKAVYHTKPANRSQSLIKGICYPKAFNFTSKATSWGCRHEIEA